MLKMFLVTGDAADMKFAGLFITCQVSPGVVVPGEVDEIPKAFINTKSTTCSPKASFSVVDDVLHFIDDVISGSSEH